MSAESERTGELTPIQYEGLEIYQRMQESEKAFREVQKFEDLDKPKNRKILAKALNAFVLEKVKTSDLEGCHFMPFDENLQDELGIKFFPVTVVVPIEKWSSIWGHNRETGETIDFDSDISNVTKKEDIFEIINGIRREGFDCYEGAGLHLKLKGKIPTEETYGFHIPAKIVFRGKTHRVFPYPHGMTGISFYSENYLSRINPYHHEELHQIYELYSRLHADVFAMQKQDDDSAEYKKKNVEDYILKEINSYRLAARNDDPPWRGRNISIYLTLAYQYLERWEPEMGLAWIRATRTRVYEACRAVEHLQKYLPESVITHIILNCKGLDDLIAWSKVSLVEMEELKKTIEDKKKEDQNA
jgi:hypothetical protein